MKEIVKCTNCEFEGIEDDLHYRKAKPWATSEDGFCPQCGNIIGYQESIEVSGAELLKECARCPHGVCRLGKQCPEPLHVMDFERKATLTIPLDQINCQPMAVTLKH